MEFLAVRQLSVQRHCKLARSVGAQLSYVRHK